VVRFGEDDFGENDVVPYRERAVIPRDDEPRAETLIDTTAAALLASVGVDSPERLRRFEFEGQL
jgi:hypothetical protein